MLKMGKTRRKGQHVEVLIKTDKNNTVPGMLPGNSTPIIKELRRNRELAVKYYLSIIIGISSRRDHHLPEIKAKTAKSWTRTLLY